MNGVYNVFFQYSPESPKGAGIRGWGYATSKDLIHWDYKGMPIKPDHEWDANGAYSGSALINEGVMYLYYTGNVKLAGDYDYTHAGRLSPLRMLERAFRVRRDSLIIQIILRDYQII